MSFKGQHALTAFPAGALKVDSRIIDQLLPTPPFEPTPIPVLLGGCLSATVELILADTGLRSDLPLALAHAMPGLEVLDLSGTHIAQLPPVCRDLRRLRTVTALRCAFLDRLSPELVDAWAAGPPPALEEVLVGPARGWAFVPRLFGRLARRQLRAIAERIAATEPAASEGVLDLIRRRLPLDLRHRGLSGRATGRAVAV